VRILLPPSEGKAPRGRARSLAARGVDGPLAEARLAVLEAVSAWCAEDPAAAARGLSLPPSSAADDLAVNVKALTAGTMPAIERYRGVVFDGLSVATMEPAERRVANRTVLIASGAFGLLAAAEPVPDHRVPMSAIVPGIGGLSPYWRRHLEQVVPTMVAARHLVVDLRSTDYLTTPPVAPAQRRHVLSVRVLTERSGERSVVSFSSKLTKGRLARALVAAEASGHKVRKPGDVATILAAQGFRVEQALSSAGQPMLDVILAG
jgi:cytoplasmic iron level regulating protein YaaA (DUF328/UPF0246 family)